MYYVTVVIGVELYHGTQKDPVILHKVNIMLYWRYLCGDLVCIVTIYIQIAYWYSFNLQSIILYLFYYLSIYL
jgi:hypothetical protein